MKRSLYLLFSVLLLASVILTACGPAATPVPPTEAPKPTDVPKPTEVPPTAVPPTDAPTEVPPTAAPPTPTPPPPPACDKLASAPAAPAAGALGAADNPIVITFVPSGDTGKITKAGTAIADCLAKMTGLAFKMEVGTSMASSIEAMGAEKAQVSFLNTFSILLAQAKGYKLVPTLVAIRKYATNDVDPDKALKGELEPFYKGQFIANVDSGIKTFADLKGKKFCFVEPNSTSGYIIPNIILKANGIDSEKDFTYQMAGSHPNVAIAVYKGDCDAGVTFINVITDAAANLAATYPDIATKVVPFAVSEKIPNDGMQLLESLDPAIQTAITDGLLAMAKDPGGKAVLKSLYNYDSFLKVDPTFYDEFAGVLKKAGVDPAELVK